MDWKEERKKKKKVSLFIIKKQVHTIVGFKWDIISIVGYEWDTIFFCIIY